MGTEHIGEDLAFQRRWWRVERAGWAVMAALVLAALAGAFGGGPLSRTQARSPGGVVLDYPRVARAGSAVEVRADLPARPQALRTLTLDAALVQALEVEALVPAPRLARTGRHLRYRLLAEPAQPARLWLRVRPRHPGLLRGTLGVDGEALALRVWVYP